MEAEAKTYEPLTESVEEYRKWSQFLESVADVGMSLSRELVICLPDAAQESVDAIRMFRRAVNAMKTTIVDREAKRAGKPFLYVKARLNSEAT